VYRVIIWKIILTVNKLSRHIKKPFRFIYYRSRAKFIKYTLFQNKTIYRPSSYPYLSGDTLRKFSQHLYDETSRKTNLNICNGDIVFVSLDYLNEFLENINTKLNNKKYTVVAHNGDLQIDETIFNDSKHKNITFWIQNLNIAESKNLNLLPIGFENRRYLNNGILSNLNKQLRRDIKKTKYVIANFNSNTNLEARIPVEQLVQKVDFIDTFKFETKNYLTSLASYKFSVCPPGNGIDTHRIWESLFTNTIPIIIKNKFSNNLQIQEIPCLIINDWKELFDYSKNDLDSIYNSYIKKYNFREFTSFNYWWNRIKQEQI